MKTASYSVDADECVHFARSTSRHGLKRLVGGQRLRDIESGPNSAHDRKYEVFMMGHGDRKIIYFCVNRLTLSGFINPQDIVKNFKGKFTFIMPPPSSLLLPLIADQDLFLDSLDKTLMLVKRCREFESLLWHAYF